MDGTRGRRRTRREFFFSLFVPLSRQTTPTRGRKKNGPKDETFQLEQKRYLSLFRIRFRDGTARFSLLDPSTPPFETAHQRDYRSLLCSITNPAMSTKPATAAGDVELAKSRLVDGAAQPSAETSLVAGGTSGVGPTRSRASRLSSLWSDMFHDSPGEMVRRRMGQLQRIGDARRCTFERRMRVSASEIGQPKRKKPRAPEENFADAAALPPPLPPSPLSSPSLTLKPRPLKQKTKKQTKEEEDSHRTGTASRNATILSVFWVSRMFLSKIKERSPRKASSLLPRPPSQFSQNKNKKNRNTKKQLPAQLHVQDGRRNPRAAFRHGLPGLALWGHLHAAELGDLVRHVRAARQAPRAKHPPEVTEEGEKKGFFPSSVFFFSSCQTQSHALPLL